MASVVGDEARRIQSMKKTHSLCVMRDEGGIGVPRQAGEHFGGAGEDFI